MNKWKPIGETALIEPEEIVHKTNSGIILAVHSQQTKLIRQVYPDRGKVLAISDKAKEKVDFAVGDKVIYSRCNVHEIEERKIVVDIMDIMAIVKEEE